MSIENMRVRRNHLLKRLLYIVLVYWLLLLCIRVFEYRLIFLPDYQGRLAGNWHPHTFTPEDVWITASDRTKLHGWWIFSPEAKLTFLAFHGNASNIANRAPAYEFLRETPANVFALEYRGFGHSEGKPTEVGLYLDAEAAYQYLVSTKDLDPRSIIAFGQSLGTVVATHLAAHHAVGGVVLEAPFPSASRVASKIGWFLPGLSLLARGQFDTISNLKTITVPVLVVHCTHDPVLPVEFGQEVYASAHIPKQLLPVEGTCHEDASRIAPVEYHYVLRKWIQSFASPGSLETSPD